MHRAGIGFPDLETNLLGRSGFCRKEQKTVRFLFIIFPPNAHTKGKGFLYDGKCFATMIYPTN